MVDFGSSLLPYTQYVWAILRSVEEEFERNIYILHFLPWNPDDLIEHVSFFHNLATTHQAKISDTKLTP